MSERYFAPCPRGLEAVLEEELAPLGAMDVLSAEGGVAFSGDFSVAYRVNLESRVASRVLWRVAQGQYRNEDDVYQFARSQDWPRWFRADRSLRVDVAATRSPLKSLEFATLRIKDAVCDRFRDTSGVRPSVSKERPDVRIHAHLSADEASLYLDTSGEPLFKRGYRREAAEAPLRENLAAGLIRLAHWDSATPFLDPMAGSGTLAVEAALIALDIAPGLKRSFAFQKLAWYDGPTWQRIRQSAHDRQRSTGESHGAAPMFIHASDSDPAAVARCRASLVAAGVANVVDLQCLDVLQRTAPAPEGTIVTNPPYGVRLADADSLARFYPSLGDALKQRFAGWTAYIFSGDARLPKLFGLKASRRTPLYNGAIECRLYEYALRAGSMRRPQEGAGSR